MTYFSCLVVSCQWNGGTVQCQLTLSTTHSLSQWLFEIKKTFSNNIIPLNSVDTKTTRKYMTDNHFCSRWETIKTLKKRDLQKVKRRLMQSDSWTWRGKYPTAAAAPNNWCRLALMRRLRGTWRTWRILVLCVKIKKQNQQRRLEN